MKIIEKVQDFLIKNEDIIVKAAAIIGIGVAGATVISAFTTGYRCGAQDMDNAVKFLTKVYPDEPIKEIYNLAREVIG